MSIITENLSTALKDLNLLVSHFENEKINKLDKDLALSKVRTIYDCLLHLETVELTNVAEKTLEKTIQYDTPNENLKEKAASEIHVEQKSEVVITKEAISAEPIMELEEEEKDEKVVVHIIQTETVKQEVNAKVSENDIIAGKFKRSEPLINEVLSRSGKRDLSTLLQSKPVKSIEAAIGINERFEFVRELFNGDNATYLKTIRILDNAANFNEAFNYINQTFSWDFESETAHKLLDLVRRRYITD